MLLHRPSVRIRELAVKGRIDEVNAALETLHGLSLSAAPAESVDDEQDWTASA